VRAAPFFSAVPRQSTTIPLRICAALLLRGRRGEPLVRSNFSHVGRDVQRNSTSRALIAIATQSTEKSIWPIGGMSRRTGRKIGSQSCASKRTPGA
jgi:hypothetical protein